MKIKANDPDLKSWVPVGKDSEFPIQNIPFGIVSYDDLEPRPATRIGDNVVDLSVLADFGYFDQLGFNDLTIFYHASLNDLIAQGKPLMRELRDRLSELLGTGNVELKDHREAIDKAFRPADAVKMHLPVEVGDYTDFYSSEEHATNVGKMFRDPEKALLPNWKHIPVGYHGRSSSIVVSGTNIHRPFGQILPAGSQQPVFSQSQQMDFELEVAFITGKETKLGERIPVEKAEDFIFGLVLFNDLSARDIQRWEYVPLGPFLGKSFGSVISPWIVTLDALEPFRTGGPGQVPQVLPYLRTTGERSYDIHLEVSILPETNMEKTVCRSNFRFLYWNMCQQLAHHSVNGCNIRVGDLYASGTISGPEPSSFGSMLELSWKGTRPVKMPDGSDRKYLIDHDSVIMRGYAERNGIKIGFGECITTILPAK